VFPYVISEKTFQFSRKAYTYLSLFLSNDRHTKYCTGLIYLRSHIPKFSYNFSTHYFLSQWYKRNACLRSLHHEIFLNSSLIQERVITYIQDCRTTRGIPDLLDSVYNIKQANSFLALNVSQQTSTAAYSMLITIKRFCMNISINRPHIPRFIKTLYSIRKMYFVAKRAADYDAVRV
jgi:hypothetical protein